VAGHRGPLNTASEHRRRDSAKERSERADDRSREEAMNTASEHRRRGSTKERSELG
jgi:hypothetical protein